MEGLNITCVYLPSKNNLTPFYFSKMVNCQIRTKVSPYVRCAYVGEEKTVVWLDGDCGSCGRFLICWRLKDLPEVNASVATWVYSGEIW